MQGADDGRALQMQTKRADDVFEGGLDVLVEQMTEESINCGEGATGMALMMTVLRQWTKAMLAGGKTE